MVSIALFILQISVSQMLLLLLCTEFCVGDGGRKQNGILHTGGILMRQRRGGDHYGKLFCLPPDISICFFSLPNPGFPDFFR